MQSTAKQRSLKILVGVEGGDLSGIAEAWKEISKKYKIHVIIFTTLYRFKAFVSLET